MTAPASISIYEHEIKYYLGPNRDKPTHQFEYVTWWRGQVVASGGGKEPMKTKRLPPANQAAKIRMIGDEVFSLPCRVPLMEKKLYRPDGTPTGKPMTVYLEIKQ